MDYHRKYLKYKKKYLELKSQKGGSVEVLDNLKNSNLIIILGSNIKEPHIVKFINDQEPNTVVLCIDIDINKNFANSSTEPEPFKVVLLQGKILLQIIHNFNDFELWDSIREKIYSSENLKLKKIIVDWSTAKYMNDSFNLDGGSVMSVIKEFMTTHNTEFFSPCCFSSAFINDEQKRVPNFYPYFNLDLATPLLTEIEDINQIYISEFNSKSENHKIIYQSESNDQRLFYPIIRTPDSCNGDNKGCPINRFIIITNKN